MADQVLVCTCGDCDDWVIGKDKAGTYIKCMTCNHRFVAKFEIDAHEKLRYRAAKPALARGRKMVPKGSRKRPTTS